MPPALFGSPVLSALAAEAGHVTLPFENGERELVAYPQKRPLILLTARPPQLETPFSVFNESVITPNDAFFVRYHWSGIPTASMRKRTACESAAMSIRRWSSRSPTSSKWPTPPNWLPLTSVPVTAAATCRRAPTAANYRMVPWATRAGPASRYARCWKRRA